jgi:hypothetical protein
MHPLVKPSRPLPMAVTQPTPESVIMVISVVRAIKLFGVLEAIRIIRVIEVCQKILGLFNSVI